MGNCLDRNISDDEQTPIDVESSMNESNSYVNQNYPCINNSRALAYASNQLQVQHQHQQSREVFYITPNVSRTADQLTEEEQIKLLKRMALVQQLPSGLFDENKKHKECEICLMEFVVNDKIKFLPCMHTFHQSCIDSWLMRSLTCPSCMEPVDAGLLSAYENE